MAKIVLDMSMSLDGFITGPRRRNEESDGCGRAPSARLAERRIRGSADLSADNRAQCHGRPVAAGTRRTTPALPRLQIAVDKEM